MCYVSFACLPAGLSPVTMYESPFTVLHAQEDGTQFSHSSLFKSMRLQGSNKDTLRQMDATLTTLCSYHYTILLFKTNDSGNADNADSQACISTSRSHGILQLSYEACMA